MSCCGECGCPRRCRRRRFRRCRRRGLRIPRAFVRGFLLALLINNILVNPAANNNINIINVNRDRLDSERLQL